MNSTNSTSAALTGSFVDDCIAAMLIALLAIVGMTANALVIYLIIRIEALHHKFTTIFLSIAAADFCVLAMFLFWAAPLILTQSTLGESFLSQYIFGPPAGVMFMANILASLCTSANRFVATCFPTRYADIFTTRNVRLMLLVCWLLSVLVGVIVMIPGCTMKLWVELYAFEYAEVTRCVEYLRVIVPTLGSFPEALMFLLTILTFRKLRSRRTAKKAMGSAKTNADPNESKERAFFMQTCFTSVASVVLILDYLVLPLFFPASKWFWLFTKTFSWMLDHCLNGITFLCLNQECRQFVRDKFRPSATQVVTISHTQRTGVV